MNSIMAALRENRWLPLCMVLSLLIQFMIASVANPVQIMNDARSYSSLAERTYEAGGFYPLPVDVYTDYLFAPGYINFLVLCYHIVHSATFVYFINVGLNFILIGEILYLGERIFSRKVAVWAAAFVIFSVTTYATVAALLTEQLYTVLVFGSFCLAMSGKRSWSIVAGILLGLANWVRPLAVAWLLGFAIFAFYKGVRKYALKSYAIATVCTMLAIGGATYMNIGYFACQSSTSGVNLIMSANDYTHGNTSTGSRILQPGEAGYVDASLTFRERDKFWRDKAIEWIKENPERYFGLMPVKFARLYGPELGFMDVFTGKDGIIQKPEYAKKIVQDFPHWDVLQWLTVYNQLLYGVVFAASIVGAVLSWRKWGKHARGLIFIWIFGSVVTLLVTVSSRYHYPYMPIMWLFASYAICYYRKERKKSAL